MVPGVVSPDGLHVLLATDGTGQLLIEATWPPGVPTGFELYLQTWIEDPGGLFGFAASNAIRGTTP